MGQALKKVYKGEITVKESVQLAIREITEVFCTKPMPPEIDTDDGFIGDEIGNCPLCGNLIRRTKFGYGCTGYKDGCKFSLNNIILDRVISVQNVKKLLETGTTYKIDGFVSNKSGKKFSTALSHLRIELSMV